MAQQPADWTFGRILAAKDLPAASIIVVYGNALENVDAAVSTLVKRARSASRTHSSIERTDAQKIGQEPSALYDLFSETALFGEDKTLIVDGVSERHSKLLGHFLSECDSVGSKSSLILASTSLKRKSSLLATARARSDTLVVTAYDTALEPSVLRELANAHSVKKLTQHQETQLMRYAATDGVVLLERALEKLALIEHGGSEIPDELFHAALPEAAGDQDDALASRLFSGDAPGLLLELERLRANGEASALFLLRISRVCLDAKRTQPGHSGSRGRPLFWKTEKLIQHAKARLDRFPHRLEEALKEVHRAEQMTRSGSLLSDAIAERLCLRLARCFT